MKLFKNDVGRPSNETLEKRRRITILLVLATVAIVCLIAYYAINYFKPDLLGDDKKAATTVTYSIAGANGGLVINEKYYAKGTYVKQSSVGDKIVYGNENGDTTLNVKGTFSSSIYKGKSAPPCKDKVYYNMKVISYDKSGRAVENNSKWVTSSNVTVGVKIKKNVAYMMVELYSPGTCSNPNSGTKMGGAMGGIKIRTMIPPIVTPKTGASGLNVLAQDAVSHSIEYKVQSDGNYYTNFNISNPNGITYWYKWFTYSDDSWNYKKIGYEGACKSSSSTNLNVGLSNSTLPLSLKVDSGSLKKRRGYIKIYTSSNACNSDTSKVAGKLAKKALYKSSTTNYSARKYIASATVVYRKSFTYSNPFGFNIINGYNSGVLKQLGKNIGGQSDDDCLTFAKKYGNYITGTTSKKINDGVTYDKIVAELNKGLPVIIHVWNKASPTHYVLVVGYKNQATPNENMLSKLWIVDPYSNYGHDAKGENVLWEGIASNRPSTIRGMHTDNVYYVWS